MNGIPVESAMIKKRYLHNWKDTFTCCEVLSIGNGSGVTGFLFSIFFRGKEREKETKDKFCIKKERERVRKRGKESRGSLVSSVRNTCTEREPRDCGSRRMRHPKSVTGPFLFGSTVQNLIMLTETAALDFNDFAPFLSFSYLTCFC